jgi:glutamyl-tRNA synthetase
MSRAELIENFALDSISGGNAVFNTEKLDWMNAQYLARMPVGRLAELVLPLLADAGLGSNAIVEDEGRFHRLLELLRPRAKRLPDFVDQGRPLLAETVEYEPDAVAKHLSGKEIAAAVSSLAEVLRSISPFDETHVETAVRGTAAQRGMKAGQLIHAVRVALTGRTTSPGLFETIALLGRELTVSRLMRLCDFLASPRSTVFPTKTL